MTEQTEKGNDPKRWEKLLVDLDEKLQLGLLEYLRRVNAYHFEEDILYIEPANEADHEYLAQDSVFQQLQIYAQHAVGVDKVKLKALTSD